MLFNSIHFFIFLVVVLIISALLRRYSSKAELFFLVVASAYFYGQWSWAYLLLIYLTIMVDFLLGLMCYKSKNPQGFLFISLFVNLGILAFFKYANFIISSTNDVSIIFGNNLQVPLFDLLLPVGISFYTFQSLSYTIDIYRKHLKPRQSIWDYALFVSFFPQLVAGPIVRASEFFDQLDKHRNFSFLMAQSGVFLIALGLVKKVVFADNLALFVDPIFDAPNSVDSLRVLLAVYGFAFQIYFDFSGYSDIAIGVAKLLGFSFPKNFNYPYLALSITDFWRRWHMTLSRWLRDYLYISLGGNRKGSAKTMRNLFLTMFLGGLWHGASWNFALWGTLHGVYLGAEKLLSHYLRLRWNRDIVVLRFFKWLLVFHLVCFAWIFFRAETWDDSMSIINNLVQWSMTGVTDHLWLPMSLILSMPLLHLASSKINLSESSVSMGSRTYILLMTLFLLLLVLFSPEQGGSFMYFQF